MIGWTPSVMVDSGESIVAQTPLTIAFYSKVFLRTRTEKCVTDESDPVSIVPDSK